jgi:16S rRNA (guanine527-N7)-methyltransferase
MPVPRGTFDFGQLPEGVAEDLTRYADLVRHWSSRVNLVAPGDLEHLERRHISDCLRLLPLLEALPVGPAVDVGSGAGLPGVVLALADRGRHWRLLEPQRRRAAFLDEVVRALGLAAEVITLAAAAAAQRSDFHGVHVLATARALAPPANAFRLLEPLTAPTGVRVVMVGRRARIPAHAEEWTEGVAIIRGRARIEKEDNGNL